MIINIFVLVIIMFSIPFQVWSHPGHGVFTSESLAHLLVEHGFYIIPFIFGAGWFFIRKVTKKRALK